MQKAISKYWPVFVLPTLLAFIIGFIWPFIWGIYLSFQRFTTVSKTTFVGMIIILLWNSCTGVSLPTRAPAPWPTTWAS